MNNNFILFDDWRRDHLLPLTLTRPVADLRIGILTIKEKWEFMLDSSCYFLTVDYLSKKFEFPSANGNSIYINGGVLPNASLIKAIAELNSHCALVKGNTLIAFKANKIFELGQIPQISDFTKTLTFEGDFIEIIHPWHIFTNNGEALKSDFDMITANRISLPISSTNTAINPNRIFIEEGATIECAILNASNGPIYIGKGAEIMEGSIVRGPFALCDHSVLKMGAKIYGPTTIGPFSKVGGEVNNSVLQGQSNKAHDGFIGNSVIGEWCNLGADTNCSNLKNNYASVKVWSYAKQGFLDTGLQFCGLIMGDHSKCGINTMFNTGTVVGVSANIFGDGFPRNFIPSFSWGGAHGFSVYQIDKALETAERVMARRGIPLNSIDTNILSTVFSLTKDFRK
jgi:UDP-N-acetylglucosamine diphosphorylase/glucosamine-1-phosphate N-acetyltransferase